MRKLILTLAAIGLVAVPVGAATGGPAEQKVTGGGQFAVPENGRGPGNTIAVSVKSVDDTVTGNITYVARSDGDHIAHHGTATCLEVRDNVATIGGTWAEGGEFLLKVVDDGKDDEVALWSASLTLGDETIGASAACALAHAPLFDTDDLDRGNLKIHS